MTIIENFVLAWTTGNEKGAKFVHAIFVNALWIPTVSLDIYLSLGKLLELNDARLRVKSHMMNGQSSDMQKVKGERSQFVFR